MSIDGNIFNPNLLPENIEETKRLKELYEKNHKAAGEVKFKSSNTFNKKLEEDKKLNKNLIKKPLNNETILIKEKKEIPNSLLEYYQHELLKSTTYENFLNKYIEKSKIFGILPLNEKEKIIHDQLFPYYNKSEKEKIKEKLFSEINELFK